MRGSGRAEHVGFHIIRGSMSELSNPPTHTHSHTQTPPTHPTPFRPQKNLCPSETTLAFPWRLKSSPLKQLLQHGQFPIYGAVVVKCTWTNTLPSPDLYFIDTPNAIIVRRMLFYLPRGIFFYWNCEISPCSPPPLLWLWKYELPGV